MVLGTGYWVLSDCLPDQNPEPGTRNPKPGTRNPEPGTRNPEPGTRNLEPGTLNPEPGTRNPEPGTPYSPNHSLAKLTRYTLSVDLVRAV
jgi:hypothetical protein